MLLKTSWSISRKAPAFKYELSICSLQKAGMLFSIIFGNTAKQVSKTVQETMEWKRELK